MKVQELIAELQNFHGEREVFCLRGEIKDRTEIHRVGSAIIYSLGKECPEYETVVLLGD